MIYKMNYNIGVIIVKEIIDKEKIPNEKTGIKIDW